jgi:hypothetical protein
MSSKVSMVLVSILLALALTLSGCGGGANGGPRVRFASYPTATGGTNFTGQKLGAHGYHGSGSERNGIAYTCAGGHVDIAHLRKAADWTLYLAAKAYDHMQQGDTEFSFKLYEPSLYYVTLSYPEVWDDMSERDREALAHDISVGLGQYFAFTATTWHEIISYFGYRSTGIFPEHASAFSWEDSYSNLLGTHIAAEVLENVSTLDIKDTNEYDMAMTVALDVEMAKLGIQSSSIARDAAASVRGRWFTGDLIFVNMKKRHFDVGVDDGMVTPLITAPEIGPCGPVEPASYPAPELNFVSQYGFGVNFEMEVREGVKRKILRVVYPDEQERQNRIRPSVDFAKIMRFIERDAIENERTIPDEDATGVVAHGGHADAPGSGRTHLIWQAPRASDTKADDQVDFKDLVPMTFRWLEDGPLTEEMK